MKEDGEEGEAYGMEMNNWGNLGNKRSFKKKRNKKLRPDLCHINFRSHKGSNTCVVIDNYEPRMMQSSEVLEVGKEKREKGKSRWIILTLPNA